MTTLAKLSSEYTLRFPQLAALLPMNQVISEGTNVKNVTMPNRGGWAVELPLLAQFQERDVNRGLLTTAICLASQMNRKSYLGRIQELTSDIEVEPVLIEGHHAPVTPSVLTLVILATSLAEVFVSILGKNPNTFTVPYYQENGTLNLYLDYFYDFCNTRTSEGASDAIVNAVEFVRSRADQFSTLAEAFCKEVDFSQLAVRAETPSAGGSPGCGTGVGNFKGLSSVYLGVQIADLASTLLRTDRKLMEKFKGLVRGHQFSLQESLVDFNSTLRGKFEGLFKSDYSYAQPNKRYMFTGVIMPSLIGNTVKLAFAVDHSGSISESDSAHQLGVIDSVLNKHPSHQSSLMAFDTALHGEVTLGTGDRLVDAIALLGHTVDSKGGTSFQAVFDALAARPDLGELTMFTLISADGAGGSIDIPEEFTKKFKGKILFVFHNDNCGISNANVYRELFKGKFDFEALLYTRA